MKCTQARQRLDPWLAGELPADESQALQAHLAQCPGCRQELAELRQFLTHFAAAATEPTELLAAALPPLPEHFTASVMQRIADEASGLLWPWLQQRRWSFRQYTGLAVAVCTTLLLFTAGNLLVQWEQQNNLVANLSTQVHWQWLNWQPALDFTWLRLGAMLRAGRALLP